MSDKITYVMIVLQVIVLAASIWEGQLGKSMYWFGAVILTLGVTIMRG